MECTHCYGTGRGGLSEDSPCSVCGGSGQLDDLVLREQLVAYRPWLDAPVGADRRCDYCGACIAKGFGVWGRPYIGTIRVEIGVPAAPAYASKSIGYHTACFEKAQSRDDRIRRLFVVESRENE